MKPAPITIRKPDPATGEVLQGTVPADHFKPKLPVRPRFDVNRAPTWPRLRTAAGALYVIAYREAEEAYWLAHAECLTSTELRKITRGRGVLVRPIDPRWEPGRVFQVSDFISATVAETTRLIDGFRITLRIFDSRPLYPRRVASAPPERRGVKRDESKGAIEAARIDGGYTTSRAQAVPGTDEEIDDKLRRRLVEEGQLKTAMQGTLNRERQKKMSVEMRLAAARRKGHKGTVRYLERMKAHHEGREVAGTDRPLVPGHEVA